MIDKTGVSLLTSMLANFFGRFWSLTSTFLFVPLYIKYLGFESYSFISFTLIIMGFMSILDSGLSGTLSREFALKGSSIEAKKNVLRTLELLYMAIVVMCILSVFLGAHFISEHWLKLEGIQSDRAIFLLRIVGFDMAFQLLIRFYVGGFLGLEKQVRGNLLQIIWGIFRNGLVVAVIFFQPSLEAFFFWQAGCSLVFAILCRTMLVYLLCNKLFLPRTYLFDKKVLQKTWKFAGGMFLLAVVAAMNTQLDKFSISGLLGITDLGYYTLATSVSFGLVSVVNPIGVVLLPRFTSLYSESEDEYACRLFETINQLSAVVVFSFMSIMVFFSEEILWVWTNSLDLAKGSEKILIILSIGNGLLALQIMPYNIAIANGKTKIFNILGISSLIITMPGYFLIAGPHGGEGVALIYAIAQLLIVIFAYVVVNRVYLKINITGLLTKTLGWPLVATFGLAFLFSELQLIMDCNRWESFSLIVIMTLLILIISSFITMGPNKLKRAILMLRR